MAKRSSGLVPYDNSRQRGTRTPEGDILKKGGFFGPSGDQPYDQAGDLSQLRKAMNAAKARAFGRHRQQPHPEGVDPVSTTGSMRGARTRKCPRCKKPALVLVQGANGTWRCLQCEGFGLLATIAEEA